MGYFRFFESSTCVPQDAGVKKGIRKKETMLNKINAGRRRSETRAVRR